MSIFFDTATSQQTGTVSDLSFSHTYTGVGGVVLVGIKFINTSTLTSVTYGGVAMTLVDTATLSTDTLSLYYMTNPPLGTNTVDIKFNIAISVQACAISYKGNIQSTLAVIGSTTAFSAGPVVTKTDSITVTAAIAYPVYIAYAGGGSITAGSNCNLKTPSANVLGFLDKDISLHLGATAPLTFGTFTYNFASSTSVLMIGVEVILLNKRVGNIGPVIQVGNGQSRSENAT